MTSEPAKHLTAIAQIPIEIDTFIALLQREGVRSYLEIGSQFGGSLWRVANALPKGSRIVSVDLPTGDRDTGAHLAICVEQLRQAGYDAHLIIGDSTKSEIIEAARQLGPFDACFIDGDHTLPGVTQDWENYGPTSRIVAFHDIQWDQPVRPGRPPVEVRRLWLSIREQFRHQEIISPANKKGIGVLWVR